MTTIAEIPAFDDMVAPKPDLDAVRSAYARLRERYAAAESAEERLRVIRDWDSLREVVDTWMAMVHLRFSADTRDEAAKAEREERDRVAPKYTELAVDFKKMLLNDTHRPTLEAHFGPTAFALWDADARTFDPSIETELIEESKLCAEFAELHASAQIPFRGEMLNQSGIRRYTVDADRNTRVEANRARWGWFAENAADFDRIYGEMTTTRHSIARKLGYDNFVGLGYDRMSRVDYNRDDVESFRNEVRDCVVPLVAELRISQAQILGIDRTMFWDEPVFDLRGNPTPNGGHDWMIARATEMYDALHPEIGSFFRMMRDRNLLDLKMRDGKSAGGFCMSIPTYKVPYIFANFNGTKHDVVVFTHEMGHAFQVWSSRNVELYDYLWPTYESCEIHSMSLEYLTWPHMDKFFGDDADRFRRHHLTDALCFLPYGVAVDHFQHLVYSNPEANNEERRQMWKQVEEIYLPWRCYGELPHLGEGGFWHVQSHVFEMPFYYIDYTLASACALQFWLRSRRDPHETLEAYVALCHRGGTLPFRGLTESAGLVSPFAPGSLRDVVEEARKTLEL